MRRGTSASAGTRWATSAVRIQGTVPRRFEMDFPDYRPQTASAKANEVWRLMELQPGDIVLANQGTSQFLPSGRSSSRLHVEAGAPWASAIPWPSTGTPDPEDIDPQKVGYDTVADVSGELDEPSCGVDRKRWARRRVTSRSTRCSRDRPTIERKGQVILYGPPGTGKTYHARRFSVSWLLEVRT